MKSQVHKPGRLVYGQQLIVLLTPEQLGSVTLFAPKPDEAESLMGHVLSSLAKK